MIMWTWSCPIYLSNAMDPFPFSNGKPLAQWHECSARASRTASLIRWTAISASSWLSRVLNDARTYGVRRVLGRKWTPGIASTPFLNAVFVIKASESPLPCTSPSMFGINNLNLWSCKLTLRTGQWSVGDTYQKNIPASGVVHSARPVRYFFIEFSKISRFSA